MDSGATPGCAAVCLRRILHMLHMIVAACLAFVCCILGGLTFIGIGLTVCLPCFLRATDRGERIETILKTSAMFAFMYGAIPAFCCLVVSLLFGVALNLALLPLTLVGLNKVGGWDGLKEKVAGSPGGGEQLSSWPGTALSGFDNPVLSVIGIVFGLGFVLSFGYWTTNFVEVQRAMATNSMSASWSPFVGPRGACPRPAMRDWRRDAEPRSSWRHMS